MSRSKHILSITFLFLCFAATPLLAQSTAPDPSMMLNSLEQTARNSVSDISRLRIDHWKADGATKRNAQSDSDSIQRNMESALPELIGKVRSAPDDLNANFKLYRNLNALYDVFSRFTETAGAFGSRDDFETLARDLDELDSTRRAFADRFDNLTASSQNELTYLRTQARAAQTAAAPPKKVVIDDSEPQKKTTVKKKPAAKPATPPATDPGNAGTNTPK